MTSDHRPLVVWTIYDRPADFPDSVVARRWLLTVDGLAPADFLVAPSIDAVRQLIPPGLVCITRDPADDPHVVESWL